MAVQTQIQTRRGTAATWTSTNPTLAAGEIGYETDTGNFKIGDGTTAWASLAYNLNGGVSTSGGSTITVASGTTVPLTIQNNGTGNSFVVNDAASDTTPFVIDAGGAVGIGTTTPGVKLDLIGSAGSVTAPTYANQTVLAIRNNFHTRMAFVNANPAIYASEISSYAPSAANPSQVLSMSSTGFQFFTGNNAGTVGITDRMRITFDGLVGINGAVSATQFQVINSTAANVGTVIRGAASQSGDLLQVQNSAATSLVIVNSAGSLGVGTTPTAQLHISTASTTAYGLISSTPVVGLTAGNTTNMAYFADQRATANDGLRIYNLRDVTSTTNGEWQNSSFRIQRNIDGVAVQGEIAFGPGMLSFAGASGEVMRVTGASVGIGTTTPAAMLDVNGSIKSNNMMTGNPVINSAFQIWQRGTSVSVAAGVNAYTADRWSVISSGNNVTVSRQATSDTTNLPFIQYCGRFQRNSGQTSTQAIYFGNSFESINSIPFAGKTVTLSYYARAGANYSSASNTLTFVLYSGTGTDQSITGTYTGTTNVAVSSVTLTTTWQRFTVTGTIPSSATEIAVSPYYSPSGTAGANDYFEITGVQIDIGSVALPFRTYAATIQGELAACRRYLPAITLSAGNSTFNGYAYGTNACVFVIPFDTPARTNPTGITIPGVASNFTVRTSTNADALATTMTFDIAGLYSASILTNGTITAGTPARLTSNAGGGYILFTGCEL